MSRKTHAQRNAARRAKAAQTQVPNQAQVVHIASPSNLPDPGIHSSPRQFESISQGQVQTLFSFNSPDPVIPPSPRQSGSISRGQARISLSLNSPDSVISPSSYQSESIQQGQAQISFSPNLSDTVITPSPQQSRPSQVRLQCPPEGCGKIYRRGDTLVKHMEKKHPGLILGPVSTP